MPYIGKSTTIGVRQRYMYTATASQTTFSGTDTQNLTLNYTDSNFVDVYLNGVLLKTGTDYTATSGTSVVLASGAVADDIVEIIVYDTFAVANFYNRTDSDSRYVNIDGDTMTGALAGTTATFSGIIKTDDTTDATSTTDGSLQTDGGLSVVKKSVFGDDVTIISGSSPEIKIAPNDATAAFFKGDSNRSSAGQHLTEFQGYWNGTQVARIVVAAGDDTTNKDDGHLDFYTTPSGGSSTRAMRIKSDGFVGIGTDSPAYRLHQHESTSGENYHLFTNSTTGTTSSDGFRIGIDSNENALVWHREANSIQFATSNTERAVFGTSEAVFNEASNDYNFRVESDGNANMLFVDAGNNRVGLGTNAPDSFAHFQNADSTMEHRIETTATNGTAQTKYKNDAQQYSVGVNNVDQFFLYDVTAAKHRLEVNSTEMVINDDSANTDFRVESDNSANMIFVDAGNNSVGIGDSAPPSSVKLAIQTDGIGLRLDGTADTTRTIFFRNTTTSNPAQILADGSLRLRTEDASTAIIFNTNSSGTNNERMRIDSTGDVTISDGDLVIGTSGHGIDFSATTDATGMSNELLDDYEEGTWTPTVQASGGSSGQAYSQQVGNYTKIGNLVTIFFTVVLTNEGTHSGSELKLFGLPFTVKNNSAPAGGSINFANNLGNDVMASMTLNGNGAGNTTTLFLNHGTADSTNPMANNETILANTSRFDGFACYLAA